MFLIHSAALICLSPRKQYWQLCVLLNSAKAALEMLMQYFIYTSASARKHRACAVPLLLKNFFFLNILFCHYLRIYMFLNDDNRDVLGDTEMLVSAADQPRRAFNFALTINTIWSAALNDRSVRRAPLTRILTTPPLHDFLSVTDGKGNALGRVVCVAPGILGIPASRVDGVSTCSLLHSCFGLWEQERS